MENQKLEVGSTAEVKVDQKDNAVIVVSLNYHGDTYRGVLINTTSTIQAVTSRISVPALSKRPKPFLCNTGHELWSNSQLGGQTCTEITTENNIKIEKDSKFSQNNKITGLTENTTKALNEVKETISSSHSKQAIADSTKDEQITSQQNANLTYSIQENSFNTRQNISQVNGQSESLLVNDHSSKDMQCTNKRMLYETNRASNITNHDGNDNEVSCHSGGSNSTNSSSNRRKMANINNRYCQGYHEIHSQNNGLSSKRRRRSPKFTSTYYLASSKKSASIGNSTMTNSKMPGHTVDDICNKLHAVAHSKRKNGSDNRCGTEKKVKGMKIINSDNSKTTVKYDPSCRTFQVGDIVWGKVQGHPWWPGRIVSLDATVEEQHLYPCKAVVAWYNSNTCSIISARRLYDFDESYDLRHMPKRRGAYQKAVEDALLASRQQQSFNVVAN
ncbi:PWWP domain-containing protein 2A [Trichoplax sp. H2]|nr:PWWP domain-containing protein 2A [Trichoplax sp. H2]|eukprot:RDD38785.1 PWWP domain-containing protein 2A [Trichoplax sp. H2]